ncbi:MAG: hypothetical protein DIKNOCCD_01406 [bacterium]|nr:hypothetical protein [bacterium]MCE7908109.1 endolytic transglycosylase MltG [Candidatus Omnitrophica bacterium COP1]
MRRLYRLVAGIILVFEITILCGFSQKVSQVWVPSKIDSRELIIQSGEPFRQVTREIAQLTGFEQARALNQYGVLAGLDRRMKKGRYRVPGEWSPAMALEQTAVGPNDPRRVKINPGFTLRDCARSLQESGWVESATAWIRLVSPDTHLNVRRDGNLEGLIAPESYFFDEAAKPEEVLDSLHNHWCEFMVRVAGTSNLYERLRNGLTLYDSIILASIIEKEAAKPPEMATAASVFHNRLRKNWPLGSAATLRYALQEWKGRDDQLPVKLKSPFNTSRKPGLPPHPICIPSEAALTAVISPPHTDFLFFSGNGEGGLTFNKNMDGHRRSVKSYYKKLDDLEKQQAQAAASTIKPSSGTLANP